MDLAKVGERYLDHVAWRARGKRFIVDKLPANFLNAGFIAAALPQAKIVHLVRDPMDACFSNLKEIFSGVARYSYDQQDMADYCADYHALMAHWRARFPDRILDVGYADLVRDPEHTLARVAAFCGMSEMTIGAAEAAENKPITTASSAQVRGEIHQRGLGAWTRYAPQLEPLRRRLAARGLA